MRGTGSFYRSNRPKFHPVHCADRRMYEAKGSGGNTVARRAAAG